MYEAKWKTVAAAVVLTLLVPAGMRKVNGILWFKLLNLLSMIEAEFCRTCSPLLKLLGYFEIYDNFSQVHDKNTWTTFRASVAIYNLTYMSSCTLQNLEIQSFFSSVVVKLQCLHLITAGFYLNVWRCITEKASFSSLNNCCTKYILEFMSKWKLPFSPIFSLSLQHWHMGYMFCRVVFCCFFFSWVQPAIKKLQLMPLI